MSFLILMKMMHDVDDDDDDDDDDAGEEPEPGIGMCGWLLTAISWFVVIVTLPFSLCVCFKVTNLTNKYCQV